MTPRLVCTDFKWRGRSRDRDRVQGQSRSLHRFVLGIDVRSGFVMRPSIVGRAAEVLRFPSLPGSNDGDDDP